MKHRKNLVILLLLFVNVVYGQEALDFTITDTKGESWNLYDELATGKTVVLDFFFVDCTPCQKFTPALARLLAEYNQDSLLVLGISNRDQNVRIEKFESDFGANYPSAGVEGGGDSVTSLYASWFSFIGWPTYAVVCPNRQIHWDLKRDTNFVELRQKIQGCSGTLSAQSISKSILNTFPNPTSSNSTISLNLLSNEPYAVNLVSLSGQIIFSQLSNKSNKLKIPSCENGVYYLEIIQKSSIFQSKIIIQNN